MPKKNYNRSKIKKQFMLADTMNVKEFLQYNLGNYTGTMRTQTTGRSEEKKQIQIKAMEQARKEIEEEMKEMYKPQEKELRDKLSAVMNLVDLGLDQMGNHKNIDWNAIERVRKIIKTELGEPTTINKSKVDGNIDGTLLLKRDDSSSDTV